MRKTVLTFIACLLLVTGYSQNWSIVSKYYYLNDVFAIDKDTVIAVGKTGLIIRSTDGGANWKYLNCPTQVDLNGVFFPTPTNGYIVGVNGAMLQTTDAGRTWTTKSSGTTSTLDDIYFLNSTTGFIVGANDRFMKTTNGGTTWTIGTVISSFNWLKSVHFINSLTGMVGGTYGELYYTNNGGSSWQNRSIGATDKYTLQLFSSTKVVMSGPGQNINQSINTGTTWTQLSANAFRKMVFLDTLRGWGVSGTTIKKTIDGGVTWTSQTNPTTRNLYAIHFLDTLRGWIAADGAVLRTTDGGVNWLKQASDISDAIYEDAHFVSTAKGWAVGNGSGGFNGPFIMSTTDAGTTWKTYQPSTTGVKCVHFINKDTGWVAGNNFNNTGNLYRTVDGGTTWSTSISNTVFDEVWFKDYNNGFRLSSYLSTFDKTVNGGTTWTNVSSFSSGTGEINFPTSTTGYAYTNGSNDFKTINGGTTWTNPVIEFGYGNHFANANKGWIVYNGGSIKRTNDGGISWYTLTTGTTQPIRDVFFTDDVHGYAAGDNGALLETSNGGATWTSISMVPTALHAVHGDTDAVFVTGANGVILKKSSAAIPVCNGITSDFKTPIEVFVNDTVWFSNTSAGAATYSWTDNSVGFSTGTSPYIVFTTAGVHKVCLSATNGNCTDTWCKNITVYNCGTNWISKAVYPPTGNKPYSAIAFSIGSKGYTGTGWDGTFRKDFWEYSTGYDTWTQKADINPGRYDASGFAIGGKGYVCCGYTTGYVLTKDLWEYDPVANTWTQKANLPGNARAAAATFVIGGKGYLAGGAMPANTTELWQYDPGNNTWTQKTSMGGLGRIWAVGFAVGAKGYVCTGTTSVAYTPDVWEYDSNTDTWTQKVNFPGNPRNGAAGFADGTYGYLGTGKYGSTSYAADFWRYNPGNDSWTPISSIGGAGGRQYASAFYCGTSGYVVLGNTWSSGPVGELWQYKSCAAVTSLKETETASVTIFPNPMNESVIFSFGNNKKRTIELFSAEGKLVLSRSTNEKELRIERGSLTAGIYFWKVTESGITEGSGKLAVY